MHRSVSPGPDGWTGPYGYDWDAADPASDGWPGDPDNHDGDPADPDNHGWDPADPESDPGISAGPDHDWDPGDLESDSGYRGAYGYGWVPGARPAPRPPTRSPHRGPSRTAPFRTGPSRDGQPRSRRRPLRQRLWVRITVGLLATFLAVVAWSVGNALTVPGGGTVSDRLAEWARDHHLGPVVTFGEWLTYQPPKVGGKPAFALTAPGAAAGVAPARSRAPATFAPPAPLRSLAGHPLPGEGQWRVLGTVHGTPAIYGTYLRASSVYSSYVAGIASLNQNLVRFELRPGSEDPGPGNWKALPYIAPGTRSGLMATFNSGFKIAQSGGGFYLNGAAAGTLTRGIASVVYYRDGRISIGVWGQTARMTPDVVAVRQNLHLIVDNGQIPASVDTNVESSWGATLGGGYYVWRSGIGITPDGRVIFAYGPALNVRELAELLKRAGAVTAMQLDINPEWMSFMYYLPRHHPADPTPAALLPDQMQAANRYYSVTGRDFTAVYAR